MARPFQIALESSDLEGAVAESENSELTVSEVIEDDAAADEAAEIQEDINRDSDALEELVEEVDTLSVQVEKNEEKLENPEEVVAADVVVSEESLRDSMVRVGYTDGLSDRLSFATESTFESLKHNPARHLSISNEGVKDFMAKVISNIKTLIIRVIDASKKLFSQLLLKFGNYEKKIKALQDKLKTIKHKDIAERAKQFSEDQLKVYGDIYPYFFMRSKDECININSAVSLFGDMYDPVKKYVDFALGSGQKNDTKSEMTIVPAGAPEIKNTQQNVVNHITSDYDDSIKDGKTSPLITVIGGVAWFYLVPKENSSKILQSYPVEVKPNEIKLVDKFSQLNKCMIQAFEAVTKRKAVFDNFNKSQDNYLATIKKVESDYNKLGNNTANLKKAINALRVASTQFNLLVVKGFIDGIKRTTMLANKYANDFSNNKEK